ncbi:MAG: RNA polymerase sigma factor [Bacteroidales bacterium]|jgi:RNA polymerase sigma-70 factor (ECF subfamily)|nr:RNA polymerase sigma factor [Bacteroidales bacterium]
MPNDAIWVSRAALLGDRNAFSRLVEAYQSPVRRFFFHLTGGDEELSKDLAQDAFVKAWLSISSFRAAAKFSTWLYRIAYNVFYDHERSKKQSVSLDAVGEQIPVGSLNSDFSMDFAVALKVLKDDERTAMLLFYMEDLPVDKISKIMNCPAGTVKSHLFRGKEKLSVYFKNSGYDK